MIIRGCLLIMLTSFSYFSTREKLYSNEYEKHVSVTGSRYNQT